MLELDFAFLNMMNRNRQGLAARKFFLDRLAPVFFSPRVENLINFGDLGVKGCNVFLPLGQANWKQLEDDKRATILARSEGILQDYALPGMAADRRMKKSLGITAPAYPVIYGDSFIKALAAVLVRQSIESRSIDKIVVVGDMIELLPLLENLSRFPVPISVQNTHPTRHEVTAHKLLYEKGMAISNSYVNPESWQKGDLIVLFESGYRRMVLASPQAFYIELANESRGLAPSLEKALLMVGMDASLQTLAPILESCLYTKAGIQHQYVENEQLDFKPDHNEEFAKLIEAGEEMGVWEPFRSLRR